MSIRSQPCSACPYRQDVPSGVWGPHEYEKLAQYDAPTSEQPFVPFACHATPEHLCHGWAVVHANRGNEFYPVALRIQGIDPDQIPEAAVPMFGSGQEACDHGKRDIDNPSQEAVEVIDRLMGKYDRLKTQDEWEEEYLADAE